MQSIYIREIFNNNIIDTNNNFLNYSKFKNKFLYIPCIGLLENNKKYKLSTTIFNNSKLFYGNSEFFPIQNKNIYIRFDGPIKIMKDTWYIKNILPL